MFKFKFFLLTVIFFFAAFFTLAQDKDTVIVEGEGGVNDTIIINDDDWNDEGEGEDESEWDEDKNWHRDFSWDFDMMDDFHGRPTITATYGMSEINRYKFSSDFAEPVSVEAKLGYVSDNAEFEDIINKYNYKFFRLSNTSTKLSNKDFAYPDLESSLWRFGFGREKGYGWRFGQSAIIPYNAYGFEWSRVEMKNFPAGTRPEFEGKTEAEVLERYDRSFRFGTSTEGGVKLRLLAGITLEAAYERSIIFERHLFWKWAGSTVIEIAAHGLVDEFIREVGDASPYVLPIVNFVLKNALSYGIYELRTEKMNWPFDSTAPLEYDQFKFGLTFVF